MDALAVADPNPGWRPFQRLNRAEYAREISSLLDLDVDVTAFLPRTRSATVRQRGDVQTFSPTLMEGYLRAASRIAMLAIGDPGKVRRRRRRSSCRRPRRRWIASRARRPARAAAISVDHTFVADGDYVFSLGLIREPLGFLFGASRPGEENRSLDRRRAPGAVSDVTRDERGRRPGLTIKTPPAARCRPARIESTAAFIQRFEGLINDSDRADRSHHGGYGDRHRARHHDPAAPPQPQHRRSASRQRRQRDAESPPHLPLPRADAGEETPCAAEIVRRLADASLPPADR
jgi:hypothetical protein